MGRAEGQVRAARIDDLDRLCLIERETFSGDRLSRRAIARWIGAPNAAFLVIQAGGLIAGDALVVTRAGSRRARLYSIAVLPEAQGRGFGRQLLEAAEASAVARECTSLYLEVRRDNPAARQLYESAGYRLEDEFEEFYEDGENALRLAKALREA